MHSLYHVKNIAFSFHCISLTQFDMSDLLHRSSFCDNLPIFLPTQLRKKLVENLYMAYYHHHRMSYKMAKDASVYLPGKIKSLR